MIILRYLSSSFVSMLVLVIALGGCANGKIIPQSPDISISGVDIVELGFDAQTFQFNLNAFNPNAYGMPLKGIDFVLKFSGITVGEGFSDQALTLGANASTAVPVMVSTNLLQTRDEFKSILSGGGLNFNYELAGKIQLVSALTAIPFSVEGNLLPQ